MRIRLPDGVKTVLERLAAAGYPGYVVGGCVRDALLGLEPKDYDVCTPARPERMVEIFRDFRQIDAGLKHGTLGVLVDGVVYEITTFRTDGAYSDNRHPDSVAFVDDLAADLARRDFTVNAMAYAPGVGLCDPFGGQADLAAGIIRAVGEPAARFREDALRILRGLRFASVYGFTIEDATSAAIRDCASLLANVAAERIRAECDKLLCGKGVGGILRGYPDVLGVFLPEILPAVGYDQNTRYHPYDLWEHTVRTVESVPPIPVLRWAMLLHDLGKPSVRTLDPRTGECHYKGHAAAGAAMADRIFRRMKFDRVTRETACALIADHRDKIPADRPGMRRLIARAGADGAKNRILVRYADGMAKTPAAAEQAKADLRAQSALLEDILSTESCFTPGDLPVDGRDLAALGIPVGPQIGRTLAGLLDSVLDGEIPCERGAILDFLQKNREKFEKNG